MDKKYLALDASVFDDHNTVEAIRTDVELNRIVFEFPTGFSEIDFVEECRALNNLEDFDFMFDITMQLLIGKPVVIYLKKYSDAEDKVMIAKFVITDRYMNLRGIDILNKYPIIVNWLVKMIGEYLSKKFPRPSIEGLVESREPKEPVNSTTRSEVKTTSTARKKQTSSSTT